MSRSCLVFALLGSALLLLLGSVLVFELYHAERIYPGVQVWGVHLGGQRSAEAAAGLQAGLGLDQPLVTLRGAGQTWEVQARNLGVQLDPQATATAAYGVGREFSPVGNLLGHLELLVFGLDLPPVAVYDETTARLYLQTLAEQIDTPATDATLSLDGLTPVVNPAQPGRRLDVEATLEQLGPAVTGLVPAEVPLVIDPVPSPIADAGPAQAEAEMLLAGPLTLAVPDPLEGDPGPWVLPPEELVTMLVTRPEEGVLHATLDEDALRARLETIAPTLTVEPVNARFRFDEETGRLEAITESAEGRALDVGASVVRVVQELTADNRTVNLALTPVPPPFPDTATAEDLGIVEQIAEGESYFIGSPTGRDHNIRLAASKFDGVVVAPGETFSFNHHLGPVTEEEGYDESFITAGEQLAMGIGGGICQVSTTAFRAAFWGGFPIVERWYHYQRVGYYELRGGGVGMDATVYSPQVDFKFLNDRAYPVLVETEVEEDSHRLIFRFYSTDDGRRVELEGPEVGDETEPGPPIYQLDEDMDPGTVSRWQSAVGGLTASVRRLVYDADGNLIYDDTIVSQYAPRRAAYRYGPGYEPPTGEE